MSDPAVTFSTLDLPILAHRDEILAAMQTSQVIVVAGETGSGKTTQLPQMCLALNLSHNSPGIIGHTQPRRIAARSVSARIADELGQSLGHTVGYQTRFHQSMSEHTRIKVMTDGILLAELPRDRDLRRYNTIIIDEAHERSLNIDVLLGYLRRLIQRRDDLRVVITSATIDPESFSEHFGGCPIIEVSGRTFPVEMRYRDLRGDSINARRDMLDGLLDAVDELRQESSVRHGDILIFLPGERDIRDAARALRGRLDADTEILPLYARLSAQQQNRVFEQHHRQRIILATNVAETSLTVPNVRAVIDTGLARISRYSARSGVQRLPIEPISQASARQRAGRCGRVAPGICIRLYSKEDFEGRDEFTQPELQRTNLAALILQMKSMGLPSPDRFPFIDPPKGAMIRDGRATLHEIGALDEHDQLTKLGRRLARFPVDPRIGRMLFAAAENACLREVLVIAAALSTQDPRDRPADKADAADAAHRAWVNEDSDFLADLNLWRAYHEVVRSTTWRKRKRWCEQNYLSFTKMREWQDVHHQLTRLCRENRLHLNKGPGEPDDIHQSLLSGLLSRIAMKDEKERGQYTGAGNTTFHVWPGSTLFKQTPPWVIASEIVETSKRWGRNLARINPRWIEPLADHLVKRTYSEPHWDRPTARVMAYERVTLYGLPIVERRRVPYGDVDPEHARAIFIREALVEGEYDCREPFFIHNRALIEAIRDDEARSRRRDLLISPEAQVQLYDARLPADITGGTALRKWLKTVASKARQSLHFSRDDLTRHSASVDADRFPDHLTMAGHDYELEYVFRPGADGSESTPDGLSIIVPLTHLARVDRQRIAWLVPGMLEDKIAALIKALPKSLRTMFIPAPDYARAVVERMKFADGDLITAVRDSLTAKASRQIPPEAFDLERLPDHLQMNIRIVDDAGELVQQGRDLTALRQDMRQHARAEIAAAADEFHIDGLTEFPVESLPREATIERGGSTLRIYPGLTDQDNAAGIRAFETAERADRHHLQGLRRLYAIRFRRELSQLLDYLPGIDTMRLHFASLDDPTPLDEQLALRAIGWGMLADGPDLRDHDSFARLADDRYSTLSGALHDERDLIADIVEQYHTLSLHVDEQHATKLDDALDEIVQHLHGLCPLRFLVDTPPAWLRHYPRYLEAIRLRLDKLAAGGIQRDRELSEQLHPLVLRYTRKRSEIEPDRVSEEIHHHRWMLEEYRVSLFAQQLGTSMTVSRKRIDKHWQSIDRAALQ